MDGYVIKKSLLMSDFQKKKVVGSFFILTYCICKPMLCKKGNKNCGINCLLKSWSKDVVSPCLSLLGTKCHVQMKILIKKMTKKVEWHSLNGRWLSVGISIFGCLVDTLKYKRQKKYCVTCAIISRWSVAIVELVLSLVQRKESS